MGKWEISIAGSDSYIAPDSNSEIEVSRFDAITARGAYYITGTYENADGFGSEVWSGNIAKNKKESFWTIEPELEPLHVFDKLTETRLLESILSKRYLYLCNKSFPNAFHNNDKALAVALISRDKETKGSGKVYKLKFRKMVG